MLLCLPALSPLLQSQLDSVPLLNKYLLNLLLTTFQLIRAGITLEILYELSSSCWLIFCFSLIWESERPFLFITDYLRYPRQFYFFQSPVLDILKAAAADCGLLFMIIRVIFFFSLIT